MSLWLGPQVLRRGSGAFSHKETPTPAKSRHVWVFDYRYFHRNSVIFGMWMHLHMLWLISLFFLSSFFSPLLLVLVWGCVQKQNFWDGEQIKVSISTLYVGLMRPNKKRGPLIVVNNFYSIHSQILAYQDTCARFLPPTLGCEDHKMETNRHQRKQTGLNMPVRQLCFGRGLDDNIQHVAAV